MTKRKSETEWRQIVADCKASGLEAKEWCEKNQIKLSTYRYWVTRLKKQEHVTHHIDWAEMKIQPEKTLVHPKTSFITIGYEGFKIDISEATDWQLLAEVLKTLLTVC